MMVRARRLAHLQTLPDELVTDVRRWRVPDAIPVADDVSKTIRQGNLVPFPKRTKAHSDVRAVSAQAQ